MNGGRIRVSDRLYDYIRVLFYRIIVSKNKISYYRYRTCTTWYYQLPWYYQKKLYM